MNNIAPMKNCPGGCKVPKLDTGVHEMPLEKTKNILKEILYYKEILTCDPLIYSMDHPKCIVSIQ